MALASVYATINGMFAKMDLKAGQRRDIAARVLAISFCLLAGVIFFSQNAVAQYANGDLVDYSKVKVLKWTGPGAPQTYSDYKATYTPEPFAATPIVPPWKGYAAPGTGATVLVIANSNLYMSISNVIDRYCADVRNIGYNISLFAVTPGTPEALKAFIIANSNNVSGCVLIGNLPVAWFELADDYDVGDAFGYASFPCDLYLMDLNGTWTDSNTNGIYDIHTGATAPEIFVGRIDASHSTGSETNLLTAYFNKLHGYYIGSIQGTRKALTYTEDDWAGIGYFTTDMSGAYANRTAINAPTTTMTNYRDVQLKSTAYDFIQLSCHSSDTGHSFTRGGWLTASTIRNIPPSAIAYNLFCCSGCLFTTMDNLGSCYIFNNSSRALAVIGSTKTGSMLVFSQFYNPLGQGKSMGVAFKEWFAALAPYSHDEMSWHYGMVVLGDPLITPTVIPQDPTIPTLSEWGMIIFAGFLLLLTARRLQQV